MPDREKVIKGLEELCKKSNCPFVCFDAIVMLKEQEAYIEHLEEMNEKYGYINIVRCKDCIYMEKMDVDIGEDDIIWCSIHEFGREIDYYCADGERKPTQTNAKNNALDVR